MNYQLLALIGMLVLVLIVAVRQPSRPGYAYQRVFSAGFGGLLFLISGVIGWDLRYSRGWFQGTTWVDGPIWPQILMGIGFLALATFWARRVPAVPHERDAS